MHNLFEFFISKRDIKETTKEIQRHNGDIITTKTKTTTTVYTIPTDIKEILTKEIQNKLNGIQEI